MYFEVWLRGYAKDRVRDAAGNQDFNPHITLVRPFEPREDITEAVVKYCEGFGPIPFSLEGLDFFKDIPYVPVHGEQLLAFNDGLEEVLAGKVEFAEKLNDKKILHATLHGDGHPVERIDQYLLRLTAIQDKQIAFSYDLVTHELLDRQQSLNKQRWYATVHEFTKKTGLLPTKQGYQPIS